MALSRRFRRRRHDRPGFTLYGAAVAAARDPVFYTPPPAGFGVPDTLDGRFDLIGAHVVLLIRAARARPDPGPAVAQAVFDAMFADMDRSLREMGVGDFGVGRRVRAMWEALHGRAAAYEDALNAGDIPVLAAALARNVWRGGTPPDGAPVRLARALLDRDRALGTQTLLDGRANFAGHGP